MVGQSELKVIEEISRARNLTQRELSKRTDISLGAVNIILKRLINRGIVKTKTLTPKKIEYFITPKGFCEKAKKSYHYVLKTINLVKLIREEIARIVLEEYNKGQKSFVILGKDNLADIIELALKGFNYERVEDIKEIKKRDALVLIGESKATTNGFRSINIADRMGKVYWGAD